MHFNGSKQPIDILNSLSDDERLEYHDNYGIHTEEDILHRDISYFSSDPANFFPKFETRKHLSNVWYYSLRGIENGLVYFWIAKELAWAQQWYVCQFLYGIIAMLFSLMLLWRATASFNFEDSWQKIAEFLWLFANFWWLSGERHDLHNPNLVPVNEIRTNESKHILEATICWLGIYYMFLKPYDIFLSDSVAEKYDDAGLHPRFSYFKSWRQYENIHVLFWIGKDYAWLTCNKVLWIIFLIPTLLIALDFVFTTGTSKVCSLSYPLFLKLCCLLIQSIN
jgi:hypothetical protein